MSRFYILEVLERRLHNIEKRVFEGKQAGLLYHVCTLDAYNKYILPKDELRASGKYTNGLYGGSDYISFSRDKNFVVLTKDTFESEVLIQLVIDGNKLSNNKSIKPYNDLAFHDDTEDGADARESEEVVKSPIKGISNFVLDTNVFISKVSDEVLDSLEDLLVKKPDIKFVYISKPRYQDTLDLQKFLSGNQIKSGTLLRDMIDTLETYNTILDYVGSIEELDEDSFINVCKYMHHAGFDLKKFIGLDPLFLACHVYDGDTPFYKAMSYLFSIGYDINNQDSTSSTCLNYAAASNNLKLVNFLLENGADPNISVKNNAAEGQSKGLTALPIAIYNDAGLSIIKALVASGADLKFTLKSGGVELSLRELASEYSKKSLKYLDSLMYR